MTQSIPLACAEILAVVAASGVCDQRGRFAVVLFGLLGTMFADLASTTSQIWPSGFPLLDSILEPGLLMASLRWTIVMSKQRVFLSTNSSRTVEARIRPWRC